MGSVHTVKACTRIESLNSNTKVPRKKIVPLSIGSIITECARNSLLSNTTLYFRSKYVTVSYNMEVQSVRCIATTTITHLESSTFRERTCQLHTSTFLNISIGLMLCRKFSQSDIILVNTMLRPI